VNFWLYIEKPICIILTQALDFPSDNLNTVFCLLQSKPLVTWKFTVMCSFNSAFVLVFFSIVHILCMLSHVVSKFFLKLYHKISDRLKDDFWFLFCYFLNDIDDIVVGFTYTFSISASSLMLWDQLLPMLRCINLPLISNAVRPTPAYVKVYFQSVLHL
jgi:hypothetical protein